MGSGWMGRVVLGVALAGSCWTGPGGGGGAWAAGPAAGTTAGTKGGVPAAPAPAPAPAPGPGPGAGAPGQAATSDVGYPTVNAALEGVSRNPNMRASSRDGWLTFEESESKTIWSFAPRGAPFYPAAVRRQFKVDNNRVTGLQMGILCEASKPACDVLAAEFVKINAEQLSRMGAPG